MRNKNDWYEKGELPPVGIECEYFNQITKEWSNVWTVANHAFDDNAVLFCKNDKIGAVFYGYKGSFRPIRTERDVLVEKAEMDIHQKYIDVVSRHHIQTLIDAGWRPVKQQSEDEFVDQSGLDDDSGRILYRAGCRFIEQVKV